MSDELVTIAKFADELDASIAKMRLDSNGIESVIAGGSLVAGCYSGLPFCQVELQVVSDKAAEAKKILESKEDRLED